jgi:DNA polymerase III epsilon subunit-like protein
MGNFLTAKAVTFLDTETICIDPVDGVNTLLSICFITDWEDGNTSTTNLKIKLSLNQKEHASPEALKINKYSKKAWADAVSIEEAAPIIAKSIAWGPIIAHNAQFDISHIVSSLKACGWRKTKRGERFSVEEKTFQVGYPVIDTCNLAYLFLGSERQNLPALRESLNIDPSRAHDALTDTEDCRTVFYHILSTVKGGN